MMSYGIAKPLEKKRLGYKMYEILYIEIIIICLSMLAF